MRLPFSVANLATCEPSAFIATLPVPVSTTSTRESPSSILSEVPEIPVKFDPSPTNEVAVITQHFQV